MPRRFALGGLLLIGIAGAGRAGAGEPCRDQLDQLDHQIQPVGLAARVPVGGRIASMAQRRGVWDITLTNGLVVHHKEMPGRIELAITLSAGLLEDERIEPEALRAAVEALDSPATDMLDHAGLAGVLEDAGVSVRAYVGTDSVSIRLSGEPTHGELLFELAYAMLDHPVVDGAVFDRWLSQAREQAREGESRPGPALRRAVGEQLTRDGSPAFAPMDGERLGGLDIERVRHVLGELVRTCSIEVGVAGDLQRSPALDLSERYLGALTRRERVALADDGGGGHSIEVEQNIERGVGGVLIGFFGPAGLELETARALRLASDVLDQRLKARVPDGEVGGRYEPRATGGGLGVFYGVAIGSGAGASQAIREEIDRLVRDGPGEEELERARRERYRKGKEYVERPGYWARALSERTRLGVKIRDIERAGRAYSRISVARVQEVLVRYASQDRRLEVSVGLRADPGDENPGQ